MTTANFVNELRAIQSTYRWYVTADGRILANCETDEDDQVCDPLRTVAFVHTGQFRDTSSQAAAAIGMSLEDCPEVVAAFSFNWHPSTRQGALRLEMLGALGMARKAEPVSGKFFTFAHIFGRYYRKSSAGSTNL